MTTQGKLATSRNSGEETGSSECRPDEPLPTSSSDEEEEEEIDYEERRQQENQAKLDEYVASMAYRLTPMPPCKPKFKRTCGALSEANPLLHTANYEMYGDVYEPEERGQRMRRISSKFKGLRVEDFSEMCKLLRSRKEKKEDLERLKQRIFYNMMTRLEKYCRTEYLEGIFDKFADFIAKLATTMEIPESLAEPFCRMHYALFCNICIALNMQPIGLEHIDPKTKQGKEYELVNLISHAILSLIIKALDAASTMNPDDIKPDFTDCELSEYVKQRLMKAAAKKVTYLCKKKKEAEDEKLRKTEKIIKRCELFAKRDPCFSKPTQIF